MFCDSSSFGSVLFDKTMCLMEQKKVFCDSSSFGSVLFDKTACLMTKTKCFVTRLLSEVFYLTRLRASWQRKSVL